MITHSGREVVVEYLIIAFEPFEGAKVEVLGLDAHPSEERMELRWEANRDGKALARGLSSFWYRGGLIEREVRLGLCCIAAEISPTPLRRCLTLDDPKKN